MNAKGRARKRKREWAQAYADHQAHRGDGPVSKTLIPSGLIETYAMGPLADDHRDPNEIEMDEWFNEQERKPKAND